MTKKQSNTRHTPGPWKVYRRRSGKLSVAALDGKKRICNAPGGGSADERLRAEGLANARLIAASPDLLDALVALLDGHTGSGTYRMEQASIDAALLAITRATS